jgi:hypothetical protein
MRALFFFEVNGQIDKVMVTFVKNPLLPTDCVLCPLLKRHSGRKRERERGSLPKERDIRS